MLPAAAVAVLLLHTTTLASPLARHVSTRGMHADGDGDGWGEDAHNRIMHAVVGRSREIIESTRTRRVYVSAINTSDATGEY